MSINSACNFVDASQVTETGWPVSGLSINQAKPSVGNARIFWQEVVCRLIADKVNLYYYTLQDVQMGIPSPSFGIKPGGDLMTVTPLFDLSCPTEIKPVSFLLPMIISSALSPLLSLLLYNLWISWSMFAYLLSAARLRCSCPCRDITPLPMNWNTQSSWIARANEYPKSSSAIVSSSKARSSSSTVVVSTSKASSTSKNCRA